MGTYYDEDAGKAGLLNRSGVPRCACTGGTQGRSGQGSVSPPGKGAALRSWRRDTPVFPWSRRWQQD